MTGLRGHAYMQRRICWPEPDATCLEGGCLYCNDHPFRSYASIRKYVEASGLLTNRGIGEKLALVAWHDGLDHRFHNAETRSTR